MENTETYRQKTAETTAAVNTDGQSIVTYSDVDSLLVTVTANWRLAADDLCNCLNSCVICIIHTYTVTMAAADVGLWCQQLQLLQLQPFYGSLDFVRDNPGELVPGELVPEETFTYTHTYRGHQSSLSASSIHHEPWHPPCPTFVPLQQQ